MVFGFKTRPPHIAQNVIVGLDFDGTISLSFHLRVAYAKQHFGINLPISRVLSETWPRELGMDKYCEMALAVDNTMIAQHLLVPGCKETLAYLHNQGFRFAVVTKRGPLRNASIKSGAVFGKGQGEGKFARISETSQDVAPVWFMKHHGLPIDYYHATNHDHDLMKKRDICKKLHARAFLDDDLKILMGLRETFTVPFLIKQPWNQEPPAQDSGIITVPNWVEFGKKLIYIRGMHEAICYFSKWENAYYNLQKIAAFWMANPGLCLEYLAEYKKAGAAGVPA